MLSSDVTSEGSALGILRLERRKEMSLEPEVKMVNQGVIEKTETLHTSKTKRDAGIVSGAG
jgi:hypothetical protein